MSFFIAVFMGININEGKYDYIADEFIKQLRYIEPLKRVKVKIIYPYDDKISGDTSKGYFKNFGLDVVQVVKNAYDLFGNTINDMAKEIQRVYAGEDTVYFVGYSGGGIAAEKTAERLYKNGFKVKGIIKVGTPGFLSKLDCKVINLSDKNDPLPNIVIPRLDNFEGKTEKTKYIKGLKNLKWNPVNVHRSYFKKRNAGHGKTNLSITVGEIIKNFNYQ